MSITVYDDDGKQDNASHGGLGRDEVVNRPPAAVSVQSADGDLPRNLQQRTERQLRRMPKDEGKTNEERETKNEGSDGRVIVLAVTGRARRRRVEAHGGASTNYATTGHLWVQE
ncbi:hypothetical protein F442_20814 [Phytophthora nicotianae P10297]|uniref:Uncharacterized protein n=1 Tax=Phytophthora nicotianae P10297 TaxID=1317064 RepID=W2Y538_PHYNI|nr:hypothetical protein F442_20814 [Phytophthora nicotianae P10297]